MSSLPELNTNQKTAVQAILSGESKSDAASAAGVTPRTFSRWMAQPEFLAAIDEGKAELISYATARLVSKVDKAIQVIDDILEGIGGVRAGHSIQLRAAKIVLDSALKLVEINDTMRRLDELERFYERTNQNQ